MPAKCAAPTTRSISTACAASGSRKSCSREGKTAAQIVEICRQLARAHDVLVTRLSPEALGGGRRARRCPGRADYDPRSATLHLSVGKPMPRVEGDRRRRHGRHRRHRRSPRRRAARSSTSASRPRSCRTSASRASCACSRASRRSSAPTSSSRVAGMEASLFSVLGGLVGRPIIAVPTSRGYGAAFAGPRLAPLRRQLLRQRSDRGQHRLRLRRRDGGVPHSFGRTATMGSKGKGSPHSARRVHPRRGGRRRPQEEEGAPRPSDDAGKGRQDHHRLAAARLLPRGVLPGARARQGRRRSSRRCSATSSGRRSSSAWRARSSPPACGRSSST